MPHLKAGPDQIFYEEIGVGEPVLLIAGFGCDHTFWSGIVPWLQNQYRVIAYDSRGMGQSSDNTDDLTLEVLADDALRLLDGLQVDRAHIVGHSMGGMVAQQLAGVHPERLRKLVLCSSASRLDARGCAIIDTWGTLPEHTDAETAFRIVPPWMYSAAFFERADVVNTLVAEMLSNPFPPRADAIRAQSLLLQSANTSAFLGSLSAETLAIVGRQDVLFPVAFSRDLADSIPQARLEVIDPAGHCLPLEAVETFAKSVLAFLK